MGRIRAFTGVLIFIMLLFMAAPLTAKSYDVKMLKVKRIKLGTTWSVKQSGASYSSINEEVLYVSSKGLVTGKKLGKANIIIYKGNIKKIQPIEVIPNGRKKQAVDVCADEIVLSSQKLNLTPVQRMISTEAMNGSNYSASGGIDNSNVEIIGYNYEATLSYKNMGAAKADKVIVMCLLGKTRVTFEFGSVQAGKTVVAVKRGTLNYVVNENTPLVPVKKKVYSNNMLCQYNYNTKKFTYTYGTPDTTPPVLTGFIEESSCNQKMPYMVVYSNDKKYDYFKYVKAVDNRGGKVDLSVNTSKVNFKKAGTYTITYTAKDKAGNKAKAKAKIRVRVANELDKMADKVLKQITKPEWSDTKKARAIYTYTRGHIAYVGYSDKSDWEKEAMNGIRYGTGDCFTYYSVARILLTRSGIPNIEVKRVKPDYRGHKHHWWNMVYVQGGFYHFDTCPRAVGGRFCLVTDAQLKNYSKTHGNSHIWAYSKIPTSGTKHLSDIE